MKRIAAILGMAALMLGASIYAQQPPAPEKPKADVPPVLTGDQRAMYFKAHDNITSANAALQQAQQQIQQAQQEFQAVVAELNKACGDKYQPQLDQSPGPKHGDPVCVLKPEPAKAPEAKPAEPAKK